MKTLLRHQHVREGRVGSATLTTVGKADPLAKTLPYCKCNYTRIRRPYLADQTAGYPQRFITGGMGS